MKKDDSHIFTFDTFEDIDLYNLSETTRNEDYKKLSEWICHYKYKQIEEHNRNFTYQKRKEYEHEFSVLLELVETYDRLKKKSTPLSISIHYEISRIKKRICFMNSEIFGHISLSDVQRKTLNQYIRKSKFNGEFKDFLILCFTGKEKGLKEASLPDISSGEKAINSPSDTALQEFIDKMFKRKESITPNLEYIDPESFIVIYGEKLKDHIFLLDELIEILSLEYDHRVISTKSRFEAYLRPRKRVIEKIDEEIVGIDEDLLFLQDDTSIGEDDRKKLANAFLKKKQELNDLKMSECEKLNSIKMVSLNIKNGVAQFKELIDKLKIKLRYFKKRQFYVEKLSRYGAEIPKFKNILEELYTTFNMEINTLQKSFLLFDMSFQKTILHAIEDQSVINRIILSPRGTVNAELAIENSEDTPNISNTKTACQDTIEIVDDIELDLSFLKPIEEE